MEAVETSLPAFITAPVRTPVIDPEPAAAAPTAAEGDAFPVRPRRRRKLRTDDATDTPVTDDAPAGE